MSSHWSQADEVFALSLALSRVPGRILVIEIKIGRVLRCVRLRTYSLLVPVGPEPSGLTHPRCARARWDTACAN